MTFKSKNVCVVVLGDIGRSPRIQYHSLSLAQMGHFVDIVGYGESEPLDEIKTTPLIFYHYLIPCPKLPIKLLNYAFKTIWQTITLFLTLLFIRRPHYVLVQNPPAIPTLFVCYLFCLIIRAKLVIDWHNYAHTIMALNVGKRSKLVSITKKVEQFVGQRASTNFCVTKAMKNDLQAEWGVVATTLYDRPSKIFHPISLDEKHNFLLKLGEEYPQLLDKENSQSTAFTEIVDDEIRLKNHRPALLISSTSWTEDEDFNILFGALKDYEQQCLEENLRELPDLICIITGKGLLKQYYCNKILKQQWEHVTVITPWLKSEDYPKILACADLGVCLHTSSSGLDLPMKVVDMFGCELPVLAYNFKCLNELVQDGENGFVFNNKEELSKQLLNWFENFPNNQQRNESVLKMKTNLNTFQKLRWTENWSLVASPIFQ